MTVSDYIKKAIGSLKNGGIESAQIDAEVIIDHVLKRERFQLIAEQRRILTKEEIAEIDSC